MATYKSKIGGSFVDGTTKVRLPTGANTTVDLLYPWAFELRSTMDELDYNWSDMRNGTGAASLSRINDGSSAFAGRLGFNGFSQIFGQFNLDSYFQFKPPTERDRVVKIELVFSYFHAITGTFPTSLTVLNLGYSEIFSETTETLWINDSRYASLPVLHGNVDLGTAGGGKVITLDLPISIAQENKLSIGLVHDIMSADPVSVYDLDHRMTMNIQTSGGFSMRITRSDPGFVPVNNIGVQ